MGGRVETVSRPHGLGSKGARERGRLERVGAGRRALGGAGPWPRRAGLGWLGRYRTLLLVGQWWCCAAAAAAWARPQSVSTYGGYREATEALRRLYRAPAQRPLLASQTAPPSTTTANHPPPLTIYCPPPLPPRSVATRHGRQTSSPSLGRLGATARPSLDLGCRRGSWALDDGRCSLARSRVTASHPAPIKYWNMLYTARMRARLRADAPRGPPLRIPSSSTLPYPIYRTYSALPLRTVPTWTLVAARRTRRPCVVAPT